MKIARKITREQLEANGACPEELGKFTDAFGDEVEVTVELAEKHAMDFDFNWAAYNLLSYYAERVFNRADDDDAFTKYRHTIGAKRDQAVAAQFKHNHPATIAYREAKDTAYRTVRIDLARAFAEAYLSDKSAKG